MRMNGKVVLPSGAGREMGRAAAARFAAAVRVAAEGAVRLGPEHRRPRAGNPVADASHREPRAELYNEQLRSEP